MTHQATALLERPLFSIVQVLEDSFEALIRNFLLLLGITVIIAVPLLVWLALGGERILVQFATVTRLEDASAHFDPIAAGLMLLIGFISIGIQAAVSDAAFQDLLGEAGDLVESLRHALLAAPSVIATGLFLYILFAIAFFMLVLAASLVSLFHWTLGVLVGLPGLIGLAVLMVRWWVLVPVIVIEQTGPIACFGRSTRLTEGNRWKIFALLLIVYLPETLVKALLIAATPLAGTAVVAILNILVSGLFIAFNAVVAVMIYGHLRAIKEGSGTAELADVFE